MIIYLKNKHTLKVDDFYLKCSIGKNGLTNKKIEGDKKTPIGTFKISHLYYRKDRIKKFRTRLNCKIIKKNMGWCNDPKSKNYNRQILIKDNYKFSYEKLFRRDHKYDFIIPIKYNYNKPIKNKGSAIFLHLTKNYKSTAGCVALKKKDFLILLNIINKNTKIKIF